MGSFFDFHVCQEEVARRVKLLPVFDSLGADDTVGKLFLPTRRKGEIEKGTGEREGREENGEGEGLWMREGREGMEEGRRRKGGTRR